MVAVHRDSAFEWYAHEAVGRHAGLTDDELDALRGARLRRLPAHDERVVAAPTHLLLDAGDLDDDGVRARPSTRSGSPQLFELLTLVGYYDTLALQLRVFRVAAPRTEPRRTPHVA